MLQIEGMPVKADDEYDGNSMLWAGLMCASGDLSSQGGVKHCQTFNGRLWRSPRRVHKDGEDSFSRDMALGFMLYVAATHDYGMFYLWTRYLSDAGELCPDSKDGRCIITGPIQWQINSIRYRSGIPWYLSTYLFMSALTSPPGFQMHLVGCHLLLNWLLYRTSTERVGKILSRRQPLNPFFMWLAHKPKSDIEARLEVIRSEITNSKQNQWSWERADGERNWTDSMGWDLAFMDNLLKSY